MALEWDSNAALADNDYHPHKQHLPESGKKPVLRTGHIEMNILYPSDTFPPGNVGGAAWSAYTLAYALQQCGHTILTVVPIKAQVHQQQAKEMSPAQAGSVPTRLFPYPSSPIPFVKNYYHHERLWVSLGQALIRAGQEMQHASGTQNLIIHAQHVQTAGAACYAGRVLRIPVIITVRDHWPWCYFGTGLHGNRIPYQQRANTVAAWAGLATDLIARLGVRNGLLALSAIPYMHAHVRRRAQMLQQADGVIAVSTYMAQRLHHIVPPERVRVIPNIVGHIEVGQASSLSDDESFLLFVGKLEQNKGAGLLVPIFHHVKRLMNAPPHMREHSHGCVALPMLKIVGNGALQSSLARDIAQLDIPAEFLSWVAHDEVVQLMAHCRLLLFPSNWGEPLSRVLLEGSAMGAPIIAMPTGGTCDIITHNVNGILAATPERFAEAIIALLNDADERMRLGNNARQGAQDRFSSEAVVPQVEEWYSDRAATWHARHAQSPID